MRSTPLSILLVLLAASAGLLAAAGLASAGARSRVITLGTDQVLGLAGTDVRCVLDLDYGHNDRAVAVRCLLTDPREDEATKGTGIPPQPVGGSYVVHATFWGGALLTKGVKSGRTANGVKLAFENQVARRNDTLRTAPREYGIFTQKIVIGSRPLRRVQARLGDLVRFSGTPLMCVFARSGSGRPTVACTLVDRSRAPVPGAHGTLLSESGAALTTATSSGGLRPLVTRLHGH